MNQRCKSSPTLGHTDANREALRNVVTGQTGVTWCNPPLLLPGCPHVFRAGCFGLVHGPTQPLTSIDPTCFVVLKLESRHSWLAKTPWRARRRSLVKHCLSRGSPCRKRLANVHFVCRGSPCQMKGGVAGTTGCASSKRAFAFAFMQAKSGG